jgi:hypothetical protein
MKKTRMLVIVAACAVPLLVMAFTELHMQRHSGKAVPSLKEMLVGGTQEMKFTKLNAGWKYSKEELEDSQQNCVIGGVVPTAYTSFGDIPSFKIESSATHAYAPEYTTTYDGFTHTFIKDPDSIKGGGTKYSQKFFAPSLLSSNRKPLKYGQFAASIKNGQMKFMYQIPKGNESGMMVETQHFGWVRNCRTQDWFREYTREKVEGAGQFLFQAGNEVSYGEQECRVKMGKGASKAKLMK